MNHVGFLVKELAPIKAKFLAAGLTLALDNDQAKQIIAVFPEGVRVEFTQDTALSTPIEFHHFHLSTPNQEAQRAWYVKMLSGVEGQRGNFPAAMFPGGEADFIRAQAPQAPTKGRALDHIGFEVKNLEAFCKKLEAAGVTFDTPYRELPAARRSEDRLHPRSRRHAHRADRRLHGQVDAFRWKLQARRCLRR